MVLKLEPTKCVLCGACEMACGYHWDRALSPITSSIMTYRTREKKNYFGFLLKEKENLVLGRPEGVERQRIGAVEEGVEADSSAKPIMLREACDLCADFDTPLCVKYCPTGALEIE
jgi:Fe-S-cluster-containing dehydrogenase component